MAVFDHARAARAIAANIAANRTDPNPVLVRALWQWLAVGALALLFIPAARGDSAWFGPMPYWLVLAPVASLLVLHRHTLAAVWHGILVPAPHRRRPRHRDWQARRSGHAAPGRGTAQRAA